jgi:hypothetical protein
MGAMLNPPWMAKAVLAVAAPGRAPGAGGYGDGGTQIAECKRLSAER